MTIIRPVQFVFVGAAFLFVAAIVFGAI